MADMQCEGTEPGYGESDLISEVHRADTDADADANAEVLASGTQHPGLQHTKAGRAREEGCLRFLVPADALHCCTRRCREEIDWSVFKSRWQRRMYQAMCKTAGQDEDEVVGVASQMWIWRR